MDKRLFNISLISLLVYELAFIIFSPQGVSITKLIISCLVWISLLAGILVFSKSLRKLRRDFPLLVFLNFLVLIGWNLTAIARSVIGKDETITTILGNTYTSLALLVPFAIVFGTRAANIKLIIGYFNKLLKLGIPISLVFFIIGGVLLEENNLRVLLLLLLPVAFLTTLIPFQKPKRIILILISGALLMYIALISGVRTMIIREVLLIGCLFFGVFLFSRFQLKLPLIVFFLFLLVPLYLLQEGVKTGVSPFEKYLSGTTDDNLSTDTRTFLYVELFEDLMVNERFLIGKGATGKYYSPYFASFEGDSSMRINVEVGVLSILLKSGFVGVLLHMSMLITAIFLAFFKSNNLFVIGSGFILLIHSILMFIENIIIYNTYNFAIWFFVGVCLSQRIREANNQDIWDLINGKQRRALPNE
ncbi:hypothetical protein [Maribacter sp. 2-571]|uniref:hypothetical protein n=1 Tax=Maribacter sp. 2-571 TaxID=3417569 RepID=UPI003D358D00